MITFRKKLLVCAIISASAATGANAEDSSSVAEALKAGSVKLHLRPRYESVEQDGAEDATAFTVKTRLTYTSGTYEGFGFTLEMDDTTAFFEDDYSDGVTNRGTAVIADPEVTEVNESYISYAKGMFTGKYGRQRIILDNQRFVGGVGWRQDEQTYDGFSATLKPAEKVSVFAAYITQANRIFAEAADHNMETVLLNASYSLDMVKLIGYGYLIDNKTALALSSDTFGMRAQFTFSPMFSANLEYATQSEAGDSPKDYSADYMLVEGGVNVPISDNKLALKLGYEVLGSDDGVAAFTTPLATLHAFQGWTDKFLATPDTGIEDTYVSAGTKLGPVNATVVYHTLSSNEGDIDYGDEIGFVLGGKVGDVGLTLKYADYSADEYLTDTTKLWLMAAMTF